MKFICIRLYKGRLLQPRVNIEISKAYPIIQGDCRENKYDSERPEIQLRIARISREFFSDVEYVTVKVIEYDSTP
jgi:hypothetical protein